MIDIVKSWVWQTQETQKYYFNEFCIKLLH